MTENLWCAHTEILFFQIAVNASRLLPLPPAYHSSVLTSARSDQSRGSVAQQQQRCSVGEQTRRERERLEGRDSTWVTALDKQHPRYLPDTLTGRPASPASVRTPRRRGSSGLLSAPTRAVKCHRSRRAEASAPVGLDRWETGGMLARRGHASGMRAELKVAIVDVQVEASWQCPLRR
ncbi:unnamed protein product [Pleuronectes platessa]|uniref:Uncharacterized protein n=1 Tax=Pleuronectes platessa TaxID=8262 RepID=A0A9N7UEW9_PLEPL|nr:unnamed protein product [Pleuronectes platessa]